MLTAFLVVLTDLILLPPAVFFGYMYAVSKKPQHAMIRALPTGALSSNDWNALSFGKVGLAYYVSDTIYIMEKGRIVESGPAEDVILRPRHRYTRQLISDVPKIHEAWDLAQP